MKRGKDALMAKLKACTPFKYAPLAAHAQVGVGQICVKGWGQGCG